LKNSVQEIGEGLFMFTLPMPFRLKHVNIFAAVEDYGVTLFDTGPNLPGTFDEVEKCLKSIGKSIPDIRRILLTHFHVDHCGLAGLIKEKSGAEICISRTDFEPIRSYADEGLRKERTENFYRRQGMDPRMTGIVADIFRGMKKLTYSFKADAFLSGDRPLRIGKREVLILQTPGHTRGHVCFFLPEEKILLAGDCILPHITPNLSPDLLAPSFRPLHSFLESLERIKNLSVQWVYPAHGRRFQNLERRVEEIKKHHALRKDRTFRALKTNPKTVAEVSASVFGPNLSDFDKILALNETYVHLIELEEESLIHRTSEGNVHFFAPTIKA
jgi:glyoxylase-like metal-dependent hydrolase (beta-lactamase superfamily II)